MSLEVLWPSGPRNPLLPHPLHHRVFLHPPSGFQLRHRCSEKASLTPKTGVVALFGLKKKKDLFLATLCFLCCEGFSLVEGKGYSLAVMLRLLLSLTRL